MKQAASAEAIMERARFWETACFGPGDPGYARAGELEWHFDPRFDLNLVEGWADGKFDPLMQDYADIIDENGLFDTPAEAHEHIAAFHQAIRDGSIEEIFVAEGIDRQFYVWEGNHRVGSAHVLAVSQMPAFVGLRR